jgi:hypothetical protein
MEARQGPLHSHRTSCTRKRPIAGYSFVDKVEWIFEPPARRMAVTSGYHFQDKAERTFEPPARPRVVTSRYNVLLDKADGSQASYTSHDGL